MVIVGLKNLKAGILINNNPAEKKDIKAIYLGSTKVWPTNISILNVWLNIFESASNKPEEIEQKGITSEGYLPACGGKVATCNVRYSYMEGKKEIVKVAENVPIKEGVFEALYLGDQITDTTLIGTKHFDLVDEEAGTLSDFEIKVYQQANLQTFNVGIVDVEPSGPYHTAEYQEPVVSLSYSAMGANGTRSYALASYSYYQDYTTEDYYIAAITHDEIDYTSGKHIVLPQKGGNKTNVVVQEKRYENAGADELVWYIEDKESADVQFVNNDSYDHAVKGINRGKSNYDGGKVAKVTLVVPMNGRRGLAQVDIMQLANTKTSVWRTLADYNEYQTEYTDINISIFRYSTNTSWQIPANGEYRTPALVYSQQEYYNTYLVSGRQQKYDTWASGAEEALSEYQDGTKTLKKHELVETYTANATVTYAVDKWQNTGYWYDQSRGYIAAVDRADNAGDTRTLGTVTVTVSYHGKTSTAQTTVKQQYNIEETSLSYWKIITPQSGSVPYYEYKDPVISAFSYTYSNFPASGGSATPSYTVSQKYDEGVRYTTAVEQYMQVFTSHPDAPYARGTRGGAEISTITKRDQNVPVSQLTVNFDGSALNNSGVTLESYSTGKISCPNRGTTSFAGGEVWEAKIIVNGPQKRKESTIKISQSENKIASTKWVVTKAASTFSTNGWGDITITTFSYQTVNAHGDGATPTLAYSQPYYKYDWSRSANEKLVNVWSSGSESDEGSTRGGTDTLTKTTTVSTSTSGASLTYSGSALNSSGATINTSNGRVSGPNRGTTYYDGGDIFSAKVKVELNGKSKEATVTVKQQMNKIESTTQVETKAAETYADIWEYDTPVISAFSYSSASAAGGTLSPSYTASQTYSQYSSYRDAYYKDRTTYTSGDYVDSGEKGGTLHKTLKASGNVPTADLIINWDGSALNSSGATIDKTNGKVTVNSLGTTEKTAQNVFKAKIIVSGKTSGRAEKEYTIAQNANTKTAGTPAFSGFSQMYFVNASGTQITTPSFGAAGGKLYVRLYANYKTTYTYSSGSTDSGTSESLFSSVTNFVVNENMIETHLMPDGGYKFNVDARAYEFNVKSNNSSARTSTVQAQYNGYSKTSASISQAAGVIIATVYCHPILVQVASGAYGTSYRIDLIRTNKPISGASASVNYTLKYTAQDGSHTVTKALTIKSAFEENDVVAMGVASGVNISSSSVTYTES